MEDPMGHDTIDTTALAAPPVEANGDGPALFPYGPLREEDARFCPFCYRDGPDRTCSTQAHWPAVRRRSPLYLSGVECAATRRMAASGMAIGLLLQPNSALEPAAPGYGFWAADNGCFTQGDRFDPHRWFAWLARLPDAAVRRRCLFAVAPDALCDAEATWQRSWPWLELVRTLGIPVALVAQNGVEAHVATWDNDECWDVCFIGGDTAWKISSEARDVAREAQLRGKWVHVGRVNSWKRIDRVADWDVDSVDGTFLRFGPDTNGARLARWLQRLDTTPTLF
jgi:hypothetical protein